MAFLSKTSLFVKSSYSTVNYARGTDLGANGLPTAGADLDFNPFTVAGGIKGLFSRRLSLTLQGGYIQAITRPVSLMKDPQGGSSLTIGSLK